MKEFYERQFSIVVKLIQSYRNNEVNLNQFVQKIDAITSLTELSALRDKVFDTLCVLEEINALAIDGDGLTDWDQQQVLQLIEKLETDLLEWKRRQVIDK